MGAVFLANFLRFVLVGLWLVILARIVLSWIAPRSTSPVAAFVIQTTEPLLAPVRRVLPRTGMFDLSPVIVLLVLGTLMRAVG